MSETYTFKTLTCKPVPNGEGKEPVRINEVIIPRIQRAYAQGRKDEKATAIREKFLNDIFCHLISGNENDVMDLHFIYGSVKEEEKVKGQVHYILELLDGQQRFTTLYLLHWYLLQKEDMFESEDYKDLRHALSSFSYETRATATAFCNSLVKYGCNFGDSAPSSAIKKARWYYRSYDKDATIAGMLTMLDAIDEHYKENNIDNLLPKTNRLQFYVLPLMEYHLSEELYMKMNARGLELTQFDNFKAEFCSAMKGKCDAMVALEGGLQGEEVTQEENISIKLDAKWIDLFWNPEKPDSDISYMRFFSRFFATRYMVDFDIPAKELEKDSRLGAIYTKTEVQKGDVGFDAYKWVLGNKPKEFSDSYFSAVEKVLDTLFDNKDIIAKWLYPSWSEERQGNFIVDASVTFNQSFLVVFGAICEYILRYKTFEEDTFKEWMRIVWNVVENTDINNLSTAATALRLLTALVAFSAKASNADDTRFNNIKVNETAISFYEAVSKASDFKRLDSSWSRSVKEEIEKALALEPIMPRVLTIPEFVDILSTSKYQDENFSYHRPIIHTFFRDSVSAEVAKEIEGTFELLKDAHSLGSIMKFNISPSTRRALAETVKYWSSKDASDHPEFVNDFLPAADLILALTDLYDAIAMNPPYMPTSRVDVLKNYAVKNYPDSKADLFSVFMDVCIDRLKDEGKYGMINMQSWMFLSSFEPLRKKIIDEQHIDSLLHLGPRTFDELSGEVVQNASFVITKEEPESAGIYYRLIDGKSCSAKQEMYLAGKNRYVVADQKQFGQIPGTPIAYWVSNTWLKIFSTFPKITNVAKSCAGAQTGDTQKFIRLWHEIDCRYFDLEADSPGKASSSSKKWFKYNKGGEFRKWYGITGNTVYWENNGTAIKNNSGSCLRNQATYFLPNISWSNIVGNHISMKYIPGGYIYDIGAFVAFPKESTSMEFLLGLGNSKIVSSIKPLFNPTIHFTPGDYNCIPVPERTLYSDINNIVTNCISISKLDWDAHETSWNFQKNELVAINKENWMDILNDYCEYSGICVDPAPPRPNSLEWLLDMYKMKWNTRFLRLCDNEEELNRRFIEIYGLEDELTPDVPIDEITILQQGEISISKSKEVIDGKEVEGDLLHWNHDAIIKQLISYIVGCWMGRYRLDRPGLNIAHPNATAEELEPYVYGPDSEGFVLDDDAIIPVLPKGSPFADNLTSRIEDFVRIVWGEEAMADNLNFIEQCLGRSIDDYVNKDFWKDHKKMYQNRPIYWLFSSKKGAFKCLVYAHRMTKHTVSLIRSKYLLRYINWMEEKVTAMSANADKLNTRQQKDLEKTRQAIAECHEYHNRLQQEAERAIEFDLDDGIPHNHALFGDIVVKLK